MTDSLRLDFLRREVLLQCKAILAAADALQQEERTIKQGIEEETKAITQFSDEMQQFNERRRQFDADRDVSMLELPRLSMPVRRWSVDGTWIALQNLLVAAANASKLLWGSKGKVATKRADLRKSLGIADSSPLRDPDLRNDFEHIDSRIDAWFDSGKQTYTSRNIGSLSAYEAHNPGMLFGHWDPETRIVVFWTHAVSIPAVVDEARAILARAAQADSP